MTENYTVGYGKPPKHSQFKKGQSGNPRGRPKGVKNLTTDLKEELSERMILREGNKEKRVSKQRALVKSLTAKAIKGDTRAANALIDLMLRLLELGNPERGEILLTEEEQAVVDAVKQRLLVTAQGSGGAQITDKVAKEFQDAPSSADDSDKNPS